MTGHRTEPSGFSSIVTRSPFTMIPGILFSILEDRYLLAEGDEDHQAHI